MELQLFNDPIKKVLREYEECPKFTKFCDRNALVFNGVADIHHKIEFNYRKSIYYGKVRKEKKRI